jgi:hypothetical protein
MKPTPTACATPAGPGSGTYVPALDGIRALAILAVFINHVSPELLPGGFVGVDVFFVLSGYLITSILLRDLGRGTWSLREFYLRRIQRLLPNALAAVLATLALWVSGAIGGMGRSGRRSRTSGRWESRNSFTFASLSPCCSYIDSRGGSCASGWGSRPGAVSAFVFTAATITSFRVSTSCRPGCGSSCSGPCWPPRVRGGLRGSRPRYPASNYWGWLA